MNFQKILNVFQLIKNYQEIVDVYRFEKYYKTKYKSINNDINNKMIIYKSQMIHKFELSIEILYNIFYKNGKNKGLDKNIFFNLIFEIIKSGFKIKELNSLNEIGIPFYIEENIFYNEFLGIEKNKYINSLNNSDNIILPFQGNLFLPMKEKINNTKYKNKFIDELILENKEEKMISKINIYYIGEILYLIRPIIYISLLIIFNDNKIIPFIINIVMDIVIYFSRIEINKENYKNFGINFLTQKIHFLEMHFRNKNYFVYLFREPLFSYIIMPLTQKIFNFLPIPQFIVNIIMNILENFSSFTYIA